MTVRTAPRAVVAAVATKADLYQAALASIARF